MSRTTKFLLALLIIGSGVFYIGKDLFLQSAVATFATQALGTEVTVDGITVSPLTGRGSVTNLTVANPEGFPAGPALSLARLEFKVRLPSLLGRQIVLEEIILQNLQVNFIGKPGSSNLTGLQKNAALSAQQEKAAEAKATPETKKPRSVLIRRLDIINARVTASFSGLKGTTGELNLPMVRMENLGGDRPMAAVVDQVIGTLASTANRTIAQNGLSGTVDGIKEGVEKHVDTLKKELDNVGSDLKKLLDRK